MADRSKGELEHAPTKSSAVVGLEKTTEIDTVHGDEATKVFASYTGPSEWTPQEEKNLVRKIDRKLLSILVLTYGLQYYDKAMLSQAVSLVRYMSNDKGSLTV